MFNFGFIGYLTFGGLEVSFFSIVVFKFHNQPRKDLTQFLNTCCAVHFPTLAPLATLTTFSHHFNELIKLAFYP